MSYIQTLTAVGVICIASAGCAEDPAAAAGHVACEPLTSSMSGVELDEIIGVGRDAEGTIVVVDRHDEDERLFVSDGDKLMRHAVTGSGEGNADGAYHLHLLASDSDPEVGVYLELSGDKVRMKYLKGGAARFDKSLDIEAAPGEELEILDPSALDSLSVENYANEVEVEYFARVGDDRLVVLRPKRDFMPEDVRLFFGRPEKVMQREIGDFQRYRDGGSTQIDFQLDGEGASVFFPNRLQPNGPAETEPVTFKVDGEEREIMRVLPVDDADLADLKFQCFED